MTQVGADLAFTVVVPGTPYMSIRYSGVVADGMMQLASLDEGRGVSTLQARRVDESAMPAAGRGAHASRCRRRPLPTTRAAQQAPPRVRPVAALGAALAATATGRSAGPPAKCPCPRCAICRRTVSR